MSNTQAFTALAASSFQLADLRRGQLDGIAALSEGRDVLAVMPTGYGKSAIYHVAGLHLHQQTQGPAVVVSPLISLQEDQLDWLTQNLGEEAAVAINSSRRDSEITASWEAAEQGKVAFLFLAPEQLAKPETVERLAGLNVALFVVDEAHCVSSWGHDFRPDYLTLGSVREQLGNPPVAALTATASLPVREEIIERLGMRDPLVLIRGFDRPNISLEVVRHQEDKAKFQAVVKQVVELARGADEEADPSAGPAEQEPAEQAPVEQVEQGIEQGPIASGLLYAATRKDTEKYAAALAGMGLRTDAYHAGRKASERERIHEDFMSGELDVVVATTAFGMGIDKPDVRFVVHADIPESLDAYYQEIGRAGRDGGSASAVLHYREADLGLRKFFGTHTPDEEALMSVLTALRDADAPLPKSELADVTGLKPKRLTGLLNELAETKAIKTGKRGVRLKSKAELPKLVQHAVELAEARQRMDQSRITMMRGYAETDGCRRQFLLGYFGEDLPEPCGNCDSCAAEAARPATENNDGGTAGSDSAEGAEQFPLQSGVIHKEWGPGLVMRHEDDVMTVLFEQEGYKTLSRAAVVEHGLLKPE